MDPDQSIDALATVTLAMLRRVYERTRSRNAKPVLLLREFQTSLGEFSAWDATDVEDALRWAADQRALSSSVKKVRDSIEVATSRPDAGADGISSYDVLYRTCIRVARRIYNRPYLLYHALPPKQLCDTSTEVAKIVQEEAERTLVEVGAIDQASLEGSSDDEGDEGSNEDEGDEGSNEDEGGEGSNEDEGDEGSNEDEGDEGSNEDEGGEGSSGDEGDEGSNEDEGEREKESEPGPGPGSDKDVPVEGEGKNENENENDTVNERVDSESDDTSVREDSDDSIEEVIVTRSGHKPELREQHARPESTMTSRDANIKRLLLTKSHEPRGKGAGGAVGGAASSEVRRREPSGKGAGRHASASSSVSPDAFF